MCWGREAVRPRGGADRRHSQARRPVPCNTGIQADTEAAAAAVTAAFHADGMMWSFHSLPVAVVSLAILLVLSSLYSDLLLFELIDRITIHQSCLKGLIYTTTKQLHTVHETTGQLETVLRRQCTGWVSSETRSQQRCEVYLNNHHIREERIWSKVFKYSS